jgi:shikimate kinase
MGASPRGARDAGDAEVHGKQSRSRSHGSHSHPPRIALIGFMGSGKSTVGRLLARELGYRFVDADQLIEKQTGRSIREIFAEKGEEEFRRLESLALEGLSRKRRVVIAAGGGAPIRLENRSFFTGSATTFYLSVSFEEFLRRTGIDPARPLLARGREELQELYNSRRPVYESLGRRIATDGRAPAEVAAEIIAVLQR